MGSQSMLPRTPNVFNVGHAYRPDIDGLRAVAVSAVLLYHAFPTLLPGGFIGVDVFFVISGYLITQLVTNELRPGTFSLRAFYERRVRRIVPPLLLVLALCGAFGWFIMTPLELEVLGNTIKWSAAFLANSYFAGSAGYFESTSYSSPLLHLWSLGVEEQFYLVWPLLLIAAARQRVTAPVLHALIGTSLAISIWGAWDSPNIHFFRLACRVWELAAGGLLAVRLYRPPAGRTADVLSLGGLVLVVGGSYLLRADMAFPGAWALVPTAGAALLLAAGPEAWINERILSSRPCIFVGRISYSLYLWHWPLLAFARILLGHTPPAGVAAGALSAAFVLACGTYYLLECPIRFGALGRRSAPVLLAGLAAATLFGAALAGHRITARLSGPAFLAVDQATLDWKYPGQSNFRLQTGFLPWEVPSHHAQKVLFIGDSHIEQYWSRVDYLIATRPDATRSAEFATYSGCPPLPGVNVRVAGVYCERFFDYAMTRAWRSDVVAVVFGAYWEGYLLGKFGSEHEPRHLYSVNDPLRRNLQLDSPGAQAAFDEFARQVARLVRSGRRVFIVLSNQTSPRFDPLTMIPARVRLAPRAPLRFEFDPSSRSVAVRPYEAFAAPVVRKLREIAAATGADIVDPTDTLCDPMACATTSADGRPLYMDSNHVRPFFARERAVFLDEMLLQVAMPPAQLTAHASKEPAQ
jgi:peptidoglycan/LPS O-acetylase OafA/YrhL